MDGSIDRLIEGLEAKFEALLAKEEDAAADDLAASLDRGTGLRERLSGRDRSLSVVFPDGRRALVTLVGPEHLGCGSPVTLIVPIGSSVTVQEAGAPPETTELTLTQALRAWAEARRRVEVSLCEGRATYVGSLLLVAADHLILERSGTRLVVPFGRMGSIRLSPGG